MSTKAEATVDELYRVPENGKAEIVNGELVLTVLSNGDDFWLNASEVSLNAIWDNPEDDVYAELLKG